MNAKTPGSGANRVLVADDNAVDRKLLATIVGRAGFEVIQAVDGNDAVEKFYAEKPDMVLLDALMPGKDGFAVAEEIKANSGDGFVPIIFLTSLTEATELARCVDAGGDDFLSKPYNRVILQAKLYALQRMRDVHQTVQTQRDEIAKHHMQLVADQEAAKAVFDNVASARNLEAPYIKYLLSPLALFNGDVMLAAQNPANNLYIMLGDFTGHGLAAAIGAMPLSDVFYGMTAKGFSLAEVVRECNRKLGSVLPSGYFCCAAALVVDFSRYTVEYWNGGLPSAYLRKLGNSELTPLASNHLPLGILPHDQFKDDTLIHEVSPGDRLFMATDGVIEARNSQGEYFGAERLESLVVNSPAESLFSSVRNGVYDFIGAHESDDDITMVEITVVAEEQLQAVNLQDSLDELGGPKDWKFSYELGPSSLKDFNPLPLLQQVLMGAPYLRVRASAIYTVLAELYSNALEHGVLGLRSELKSSAEGFAQYYQARAKALDQVSGSVRFEVEGSIQETQVELRIRVKDSGKGFDYESYLERARSSETTAGYHGRGVRLLWDLCETVEFRDPGNEVEVTMQWEHGYE